MTSELPDEIRVKVEDRGTVLLNYMLGRTFFPLTFNFEDYQDKGSYVRIPQTEILKKISAQLNNSTQLLAVRPDYTGLYLFKGNTQESAGSSGWRSIGWQTILCVGYSGNT